MRKPTSASKKNKTSKSAQPPVRKSTSPNQMAATNNVTSQKKTVKTPARKVMKSNTTGTNNTTPAPSRRKSSGPTTGNHSLKAPKAGAQVARTRRGRFKYDACFSFAGENRKYVEQVVKQLKKIDPTLNIFYDNDQEAELWGKDLPVYFDGIYQFQSRFCVMFISSHYAQKEWTTLERSYALARTLTNKGKEYILPAYFDDTTLSGVPRSLAHADLQKLTPEQLAQRIVRKLRRNAKVENSGTAVEKTPSRTSKVSPRQVEGAKREVKSVKAKVSAPTATSELAYRYQIKNSGAWMLLDGEFYQTRKVQEVSGHIEVALGKVESDALARLTDLDPHRSRNHRKRVNYAHGEDAAWVDVDSVQTISTAGKHEVVLTLRPVRGSSNGGMSWSDDASKEQVRDLLLTEEANQDQSPSAYNSELYTYGVNRRTQKNLFTTAWAKMNDGKMSVGDFLRCARLEAIFQLKTKGIVEHVLQLDLGPVKRGILAVSFRGRRSNSYGEVVKPFNVQGACNMNRDT